MFDEVIRLLKKPLNTHTAEPVNSEETAQKGNSFITIINQTVG
jgi:hypothetical protein